MTAQAWILELQRLGVGTRRIAALAHLSRGTIERARTGARLRPETEARILAVRPSLAHGQTVTAYPTRRLVRALEHEGYSQAAIARLLGLRRGRIEWDDQRIRVRNALKVRALYEQITERAA